MAATIFQGDSIKTLKSKLKIADLTFSAANNQAIAADVTSLSFNNATTRSFQVQLSVNIDATTDLYEHFTLYGIQKGAGWDMSQTSVGDNSGFTFSITPSGQVQYTSGNYTGFVSARIKFGSIITSV